MPCSRMTGVAVSGILQMRQLDISNHLYYRQLEHSVRHYQSKSSLPMIYVYMIADQTARRHTVRVHR